MIYTVAGPGFYLGGGRRLCEREGGRKREKMWKVEVKVILACFGHIYIKIIFKINRERRNK